MNDQLVKEIQLEIGLRTPVVSDYLSVRDGLCHPSCSDGTLGNDEQLSGKILVTPIECGQHAYIYNGYAALGAKSDDGKVFISGEGLKTPARAQAVNEVLTLEGHSLDPETWIYTTGNESAYVSDSGLLVSEDGIEGGIATENNMSKYNRNKLKFYIEYIMEMLQEFDGIPEQALLQGKEAGYIVRERGHEYGNISDTMNALMVSEDLIMDALVLRDKGRTDTVSGRAVWDMKQDMQNIVKAVRGLPTQFKS